MKFFHLSDLHIGKTLNGYSLRENQEAALAKIVLAAGAERPDAILICGDVYDRTVPAGEAYTIFDTFLGNLSELKPAIPVFIIAGNHDSPERLSYASGFLERYHIHISVMPPQEQEEYLQKFTLKDEYGLVNFYLLPFTKPGYVRKLSDNEIDDYESAIREIIKRESIQKGERNVILSHQFYVGKSSSPETCESEQAVIMAGGLDKVSTEVLQDFDYAALGHIHGSQQVGQKNIRYCGTPCKYSVSEEHHKKSITVVNLKEKGSDPELTFLPLDSIYDVRRVKGSLAEIIEQENEKTCHDYVSVTLTDEEEPYRFREQLGEIYDHLLEVRVDNTRTRQSLAQQDDEIKIVSPLETFEQFYEAVVHSEMSESERAVMRQAIKEVEENH